MPLDYMETGSRSAPAVVLLHAFPLHAAMWQPQLDALSDGWRVIAPNLPGFGGSAPLPEPSIEAMAGCVAELLLELGVTSAAVCGLSMGGYVALAMLRRHRPLVRALVLADTRASDDTPEVRHRRTRQQREIEDQGTGPVVEAMLESLPSEYTRKHRPDVMDLIHRLMLDARPAGVSAALEAMKQRPDSTAELAAVDVPALVVVGEEDKPSPPDVAEAMCKSMPRCRLVVIPTAGHLSNLETPDVFTAELRAFLGELP